MDKILGWKNFLFLAKASWKVKNLNHCLPACKSLKKNFYVAGGRRINISPYVQYYGLVNQQKNWSSKHEHNLAPYFILFSCSSKAYRARGANILNRGISLI